MNHPFVRCFGAMLLSFVSSILIKFVCSASFGLVVNFFANFGFKTFLLTSVAFGIGGSILIFVIPMLLAGLLWAGNGSKSIAAVPILMFINDFLGICSALLFPEASNNGYTNGFVNFLQENAGGFYTFGAIITLIVMLCCYIGASAALLYKVR